MTRADWLALAAAALLLIGAAAPWIGHLGLEYDEAHFHEDATRIAYGHPRILRPPDGLTIAGRPFPFMTMPYVGGLDAWLLAIPFRLIGTGPTATRANHLGLGVLVLAATYLLAGRLGGRRAACLAVAMLVVDLEFLLHVPVHYGPFLIQMICAPLVVLFLERWLASGRARSLCGAALAAGVAFNEKLTFAFVLVPLALALFTFRWPEARRAFTWRAVLLAALCFALTLAPVLIYIAGHQREVLGFGQATVQSNTFTTSRWWTFYQLLSGQEFMRQQLGQLGVARFSALPWLLAGAWAMAAVARQRVAIMLLTVPLGVVTITQFLADGGRLHHLLLGYPLLQCGVGVALARTRATTWAAGLLLTATGISTAQNLTWYTAEVRRTGGTGAWSRSIYDLAAWADAQTAARPETQLFTSAWGFRRQLYTLTAGRVEMEDDFFGLLEDPPPAATTQWLDRMLARRAAYYVTTDLQPDFVTTTARVMAAAGRQGRAPQLLRQFGRYRVYTFAAPETPGPWRPPDGAGRDVRVTLGGDWTGAQAITVELLDAENRRLAAWWRSLEHYAPPAGPQIFGPSLAPRFWVPLPDPPARTGAPHRVVVATDPAGKVAVNSLEIR